MESQERPAIDQPPLGPDKFLTKLGKLASLILAGAGSLCLLVLVYFLYEYSWTGQRQVTNWLGVVTHYVIPALCAAVLFASIRLRPVTRFNVALSVCSVGAALFLLEGAARIWFNLPSVAVSERQKLFANAAAAQGAPFDTRSEMQVIRELRGRGIDATPSSYARALLKKDADTLKSVIRLHGAEVLPIASVSNRLTVACNETGEFLTYMSDEHGFNNPPGLWQTGQIDVAALGDSFVQGFCVSPDKNLVSVIRERHPATLSLGIEGSGPLVMLASLKEYAAALKPRVVLWFYFEANDEADSYIEKQSPLLRRYLTRGFRQGLMEQQAQIDAALTNFIEPFVHKGDLSLKFQELSNADWGLHPRSLLNNLKLATLRTRLGLMGAGNSAPAGPLYREPSPEFLSLLHDILVEAKSSTEGWGGRLYFIYLPAWTTYAFPNEPNPSRGRVLETARQVGLPIIDIHDTFQAHSDPLSLFPFRIAHHYNEEGHRLVGQRVLRALDETVISMKMPMR